MKALNALLWLSMDGFTWDGLAWLDYVSWSGSMSLIDSYSFMDFLI